MRCRNNMQEELGGEASAGSDGEGVSPTGQEAGHAPYDDDDYFEEDMELQDDDDQEMVRT